MNISNRVQFITGIFLAFLMLISSTAFTVPEMYSAIILQFGEPKRIITTSGLNVKVPFIQKIVKFDNRLLDFDARPSEVISADKKRLIVDAFARYKIKDPLLVYQTAQNEAGAEARLNSILDSSMRQVIGEINLTELLTDQRAKVMHRIQKVANKQAASFGIDIVDVRIVRADLPKENSSAIFRRMQTEREREAKEIRATGRSESTKIIANADRKKEEILARANQTSKEIMGRADAKAIKIYADTFSKDVQFFDFYKKMELYSSMKNTDLILSSDSEVLKMLKSSSNK